MTIPLMRKLKFWVVCSAIFLFLSVWGAQKTFAACTVFTFTPNPLNPTLGQSVVANSEGNYTGGGGEVFTIRRPDTTTFTGFGGNFTETNFTMSAANLNQVGTYTFGTNCTEDPHFTFTVTGASNPTGEGSSPQPIVNVVVAQPIVGSVTGGFVGSGVVVQTVTAGLINIFRVIIEPFTPRTVSPYLCKNACDGLKNDPSSAAAAEKVIGICNVINK